MRMTLTRKIQMLFEEILDDDGKPYSVRHVAHEIGIGRSSLNPVIRGDIKNPSAEVLLKLAGFFKIRLDYFQCETAEECYRFIAEHHTRHTDGGNQQNHGKVTNVMFRLIEKSEDNPEKTEKMIDLFQQMIELSDQKDEQDNS